MYIYIHSIRRKEMHVCKTVTDGQFSQQRYLKFTANEDLYRQFQIKYLCIDIFLRVSTSSSYQ